MGVMVSIRIPMKRFLTDRTSEIERTLFREVLTSSTQGKGERGKSMESQSVCLSLCLSIRPSVRLSVRLSVRPSVRPFLVIRVRIVK